MEGYTDGEELVDGEEEEEGRREGRSREDEKSFRAMRVLRRTNFKVREQRGQYP